jgi:hypothetical protein
MRPVLPAVTGLLLACLTVCCEPEEQPGGELTGIRLSIQGQNPGPDGRYILYVDQQARLAARGVYDSGREEDITLSLFWQVSPAGLVECTCQKGELVSDRVMLHGLEAGIAELTASTRNEEGYSIPCSPEPDGGWDIPDAGSDWPMRAGPMVIEVR